MGQCSAPSQVCHMKNSNVKMLTCSAFLEVSTCLNAQYSNTSNIYTGQDHQQLCALTPPISQHITQHI